MSPVNMRPHRRTPGTSRRGCSLAPAGRAGPRGSCAYDGDVFGRAVVALALGAAALAGCGYEGANRAIVAELPALDGVELLEDRYYDFCSGDACQVFDDRSGALLTYSVDTERFTQASLVEAYGSALPDWELHAEETCNNADPSFCDEIVLAWLVRGDARIDLNLDNWDGGRFELHVDAEGAP